MKINVKAIIAVVEAVGETILEERKKVKEAQERAERNDRLYENVRAQRDRLEAELEIFHKKEEGEDA